MAKTLLPTLAFVAGISGALGCGGNVANDREARGASQGTGGTTLSSGGSTGNLSVQDAGQDASRNDPNCETICCGIFGLQSCATHIQLQADVRTPNILLVVDKSASMNDKPTPDSTQSRWDMIKSALTSTLSMQKMRSNINFGLELFPYNAAGMDPTTTDPAKACQLPAGAAAIESEINADMDNLNNILDILGQQTPGGYSPTSKALDGAYDYYITGAGKDLKGSKGVLLVTSGASDCNASLICTAGSCVPLIEYISCSSGDGSMNCCANVGYLCSDDLAVLSAINRLASVGINTFVVGLPKSDNEAQYLNAFAKAGLEPNQNSNNGKSYYPISSSQTLPELEVAFSTLITQLVTTCDVPLDAAGPIDPKSVRVVIDCLGIPEVPSGDSSQWDAGQTGGWMIDYSQSPPHLRFVGSICESLAVNGALGVDIVMGCPNPQSQ